MVKMFMEMVPVESVDVINKVYNYNDNKTKLMLFCLSYQYFITGNVTDIMLIKYLPQDS